MPPDLNMQILVVDDFATMRRIIKNILRQIGFANIEEADDGRAAVSVLERMKIDFVITDWNMPNMSGLELIQAIRASDKWKEIPILMVTAEAQKENIIDAAKAGVTNYIVKPFTVETMQEKIKKIFP
ncbi:MAG: Chemotaxis protein CheY [candidate division BRC1 bacterium ADurb.BinA364]|nr:MAG: Chemotaxis protein CheY [candidate division BRC1 bacterium ADurb.BinA364]